MYIDTIEAENFRGLPKLSLHLDKKLNIFIGKNGVGKSNILHLLKIMISQCRLLSDEMILFKQSDITNGKNSLLSRIVCRLDSFDSFILAQSAMDGTSTNTKYFENNSGKFDDSDKQLGSLYELYSCLKNEELSFSKNYQLVVFYPTNRWILEIPECIHEFKVAMHPFDAMENALSSYLDFRSFMAFLRQCELASLKAGSVCSDEFFQWQARQVQLLIRLFIRQFPNSIACICRKIRCVHLALKIILSTSSCNFLTVKSVS
ncbi:MAG: AAA family ATPase [Desulfovibrionaceae bacterium]|nr:AAA family ATPase [Desulfovibrionaceae bacterium]